MKQIILPVILLSLFCLTSCFSNPKKHKKIMETYFEGYKLLNVREGNFTPADVKEYLAFYSEIREIEGFDRDDINQIVYFSFQNNSPKKTLTLPNLWSGSYESVRKEIEASNYADSKWDGSCFAADFNGNGIDEFVFFILTGMSFHVEIYEYNINKNGFARIFTDAYQKIEVGISKISTIQEGEKGYVILYGLGRRNIPEHHRDWYKCEWSESKGEFVVVEEGHEYWDY